jgi:hypothetical protein
MRVKVLALGAAGLFVLLATAVPVQAVMGRIAATVQGKINVASGDRAVVTIGNSAGIIKGDILRIVTNLDQGISNPLAACPVVEVRENSSICEILKARTEIDRSCRVVAQDLQPGDQRLFPYIFRMMSEVVQPYTSYEPIRVHVHAVYDDKNNVTELSQRISAEIYDLFAQKQRITMKGRYKEGDLKLYPERYRQNFQTVKYYMEKTDTDVILAGVYRMDGDSIFLTLYAIDRRHGDTKISFNMKLEGPDEIAQATRIITAYNPQEIEEYVPCRIEYVQKPYPVLSKEEKKEIIAFEAGDNTFKAVEIRRTAFNIMSPVDIAIRFDKQKVTFSPKNDTILLLQKGLHNLSVSFKRGYFLNSTQGLVYTSDKEVSRDALLDLSRRGPIVIRIALSPTIGKDGIDINVFREIDYEKTVLKPISTVEAGRVVDYYKD